MNVKKWLKIQVSFIFICNLLVLLTNFLVSGPNSNGSIHGNYLSISMKDTGEGKILYLLKSFFVNFDYFLGPWITIPFIVFTIFYAFIYAPRNRAVDLVAFPLLILHSFFAVFLTYPELIGSGLIMWFKSGGLNNYLWPGTILSFVLFLSITFHSKKTFRPMVEKMNASWETLTLLTLRAIKSIWSFLTFIPLMFYRLFLGLKVKALNALTKQPKQLEQEEEAEANEVETEVFAEAEEEEELILPLEEIEEEEEVQTAVPKVLERPVQKIAAKTSKNYLAVAKNLIKRKKRPRNEDLSKAYFEDIVQRIEDKLGEFKIKGTIINILKGPVVDTYELELGQGVKVSRVTNSTDDISLALFGVPIRMVYPMEGKTTIGIEVPRNPREMIYLDEILSSNTFYKGESRLPLAFGKNAFGEVFVADLASMPHMMVAGSTGSGKSVFINTILMSLLAKCPPEKLQLILIDPKQLELALYSRLPHLAVPVITDAKKATLALRWAVDEMERRYSIMKELGVRNIDAYNKKINRVDESLRKNVVRFFDEGEENFELPYLVVIVDEFADLILTKAGKEIENNICRLAAKARASGIHLVVATQRPSVDVITGLIKSNFPTRVSFRVSTSVDSRTILNSVGAERLLGKGDMLYKHGVETMRVHGAFVSEDEIEEFVNPLAKFGQTYNENALKYLSGESSAFTYDNAANSLEADMDGDEEYYQQALDIVLKQGSASASMLQRRLRIGYNRAANLIELLEARGVIGPSQGAKARKVLGAPNAPEERV